MFRDLDSVITPREISAVSQWLDSKHAFHVMRDHPNHGTVPMMAGMWGVKVSKCFQCKGKEGTLISRFISNGIRSESFNLSSGGIESCHSGGLATNLSSHPPASTSVHKRYE